MASEFEGADEGIVNAFKEILEQRDVLAKALEFKNKQIEAFEKHTNNSEFYPVNSRAGFISEVKKKQVYSKNNDIKACVFMVKLANYIYIRERLGLRCAEISLSDLATQLISISKENDVIGYVSEYTFAMYIPFMNEEDGKIFASNLTSKINTSPHLFQNKNVPMKVNIIHKELDNEDVLEFLYHMDKL